MNRILPNGDVVQASGDERRTLERSIEQAKTSTLVYPILKAHDWVGKPHAIYTHFLKDKPPLPLVAYGYSTDDNYLFVTRQELGDRPTEELHQEALRNLAALTIDWEPMGHGMLTASGHDFSAEKTLLPEFLLAAQAALGTDGVLIATPRRRVAYAFDANASSELRDGFMRLVLHTYNDDSFGNAPITNLVFEYRGTALSGAFSVE